jgi:hypothetical protein
MSNPDILDTIRNIILHAEFDVSGKIITPENKEDVSLEEEKHLHFGLGLSGVQTTISLQRLHLFKR